MRGYCDFCHIVGQLAEERVDAARESRASGDSSWKTVLLTVFIHLFTFVNIRREASGPVLPVGGANFWVC